MAFANEQDSDLPEAPGTEASETEETEGTETEQGEENPLGEGEEGEQEGEGEQQPTTADFEEIEVDGERYAVPAKLKSAFMMQSDYTRKTQEVAEARKQVDTIQQNLVAYEKGLKEDATDRAKLVNLDEQLAHYAKYTPAQWDAYAEQNPIDADKHWRRFQQLKDDRRELHSKVETAARERSENAQREHANRIAKALDELADPRTGIKGWGPETARALLSYGVTQGYTRDELTGIADSRAIKVLHKARLYDELIAKQSKGAAPRIQPNPSAVVKPLTQVSKGASRPATTVVPSDKDSDDEWLRKRTTQIRKKQSA